MKSVLGLTKEERGVLKSLTRLFSWLNQVERWFTKNDRDIIVRSIFTSMTDLKRNLMRYIRQYTKTPKPVKWIYCNATNYITTNSNVTVASYTPLRVQNQC